MSRIIGPPSALRYTVEQKLTSTLRAQPLFMTFMFPALWKAAEEHGIDPVGMVAQSYKETGGGAFGGQVKPQFCNTAGIKNRESLYPGVDDGDRPLAHARFATWEVGAIAQAQHLLGYAGVPVTGLIVDPRYIWVAGKHWCESWSDLGGKWAPSLTYGQEIEKLMVTLKG